MMGPPLRKLSTKKFLSNMPSGTAGLAAGAGLEAGLVTGAALAIGPGGLETGEVPGAGVVAVTGGAPATVGAGATGFVTAVVAAGAGGIAGACAVVAGGTGGRAGGGALGGAGGAWPNEVNARVTEKRLTSSSVFIGLIGKFSRLDFSDEALFILNE